MLHFTTPGSFDLLGLRSFGLSSKDESHIGRYGTGLKYATAIILRLGGTITIQTPEGKFVLGTHSAEFRGKPVQFVTLNDEQLAFTTDLGKDWEPWMAYREIYSNTLDEGGSVAFEQNEPDLPAGHSRISIDCRELSAIFFDADLYFIDQAEKPLWVNSDIEVYPGESKSLYYKGIKVREFDEPFAYRYNLICHQTLTEDRTLAYVQGALRNIAMALLACSDETILTSALKNTAERPEGMMDFESYYYRPGATFIGVTEKLGSTCLASAVIAVEQEKLRNVKGTDFASDAADSQSEDRELLNKTYAVLRVMNAPLSGIRLAVSSSSAIEGSYITRTDGTIIFSSKLKNENDTMIARCAVAALCDINGRNWLIEWSVKQAMKTLL